MQKVLNESIHGYRITEMIAEGGMASVYLGENSIGKVRAIKVLKPFLLQAYPSLRQRFEQEARIITQLDHPNIRKVEALVNTADSVAMLMDYLEGHDLSYYIDSERYESTPRKLAWFGQVLLAIGYAHAQPNPVVHRDIKPSNIFLTRDGRVQLLDFGIAKVLGEDQDLSHTLTQLGAGTPRYRSPEQVKAAPIDHRSDIYSLGVTLWVLLAGESIYKDEPGEFTLSVRIVQDPLPVLPNVSGELNGIIAKATAKDPKDRFQSCEEFARALQLKPAPGPTPGHTSRPGAVAGDDPESTRPATDQSTWSGRPAAPPPPPGKAREAAAPKDVPPPAEKQSPPVAEKQPLPGGEKQSDGMFQQSFSFEGRIRRSEYWFSLCIYLLLAALLSGFVLGDDSGLTFLLYIPLLWFLWAQGAKRCHDLNHSGWFQIIPFYVLWMLFAQGDRGRNSFGDDPKR